MVAVWLRLRQYEPVEMVTPTATAAASDPATSEVALPAEPAETGTLIAVHPDGSSMAEASPRAANARAQRYEELLRSAPPPAPVQAAPEASLFDRVVAPIASALGMRPKAQPQQTAAAPPPRPEPPPRNVASEGYRPPAPGTTTQTPTPTDPRDVPSPDDGESDVVPPQLAGAEFLPPQIEDGQETIFAVIVNDNRSGVRSVSGVVASPSGSMQGFACTREGQSNRFIARITVPKDAPAGLWAVKYLTISDQASNTVTLNAGQGALPPTANFRVSSSGADSTGPTLRALWLDKPALRAGDRTTVFVQADDDKTGVSLVSGVFVSPNRSARLGFGCRVGGTGTWECQLNPPTCLDCGVWRLEQLQLHDKANNVTTLRAENQLVSGVALDVSGDVCDSAAPVVTALTLSPSVITNAEKSVIQVHAVVQDQGGCGVASLSAQATAPGGIQRQAVIFDPSPDGQTFTGRLEIPALAAKGLWSMAWVQTHDKGHNLRMYSANEPVVARATFRVE